jgi:hypothetical protein
MAVRAGGEEGSDQREEDEQAVRGRATGGASGPDAPLGLHDREVVAMVGRAGRRGDVVDDAIGHLRGGEGPEGQQGHDDARDRHGPADHSLLV